MSQVLAILLRFVVILLGFAAASLAASAFIHVLFLAPLGFTAEEAGWVVTGSLVFSIPFVALFIAYLAFVPAMVVFVIGELLPRRDWLSYALAGAAVGAVVAAMLGYAPDASGASVVDSRFALLMLGSGIVGGFFYWLTAGRFAGSWRQPAISSAP